MKTITLTAEQQQVLSRILDDVWTKYTTALNSDIECEAVRDLITQLGKQE